MNKTFITIVLSAGMLLTVSSSAFAVIDSEINESRKCSAHFSYFEKKYDIPKDTLYSISLQETQKKHGKLNIQIVWPWSVNVEGTGYHFNSKDEAIKFTRQKQAEGITSIDVGCMQINLKYHPDVFASLEQAFSPRRNIAYGAKHLREKYEASKNWRVAIGHYHSYNKSKSHKYYKNVSKHADSMENYHVQMSKVSKNRMFEVSSADDRFVVSDESAMPNEIKTTKAVSKNNSKSMQDRAGKYNKNTSYSLTENHWFRKGGIPAM